MRRLMLLMTLLLAVPARMYAADSAATATVAFAGKKVTVSGLRPGAQVVFFGVAKIPRRYDFRITRWQQIATDDDHDGVITFEADVVIPVSSVWAVVDLQTGQATLAAPEDFGVRRIPLGRSAIPKTADQLTFDSSYLDLLYVHAGLGVWTWHGTDGGNNDEDGANGKTTIDIRKAVHIAGAAPLSVFSPGGTLIAIDYINLTVLEVDTATLLARGRQ